MSKLNVLYQFNEKYAPYAATSIVSLLDNNKSFEQIVIYILPEGVTKDSKNKIDYIVESYGRSVVYIETEQIITQMENVGIPKYRDSYAPNFKMFAPEYISEDVDRLLYIDSDTIVKRDLSSLITIDMKDCPLAMVYDSLARKHKLRMGFTPEDGYYNSGVILFHLPKWREKKCTERIVEHAKNVRAHYYAPDQDLLNIVLGKEIQCLDMGYNLQPIHMVYSSNIYTKIWGKDTYYSDAEIEAAVKKPYILHCFRFLGQFPWHKDSLHPSTKEFDFYLQMTPWKDYVKEESSQNGFVFKIERWLYRHLPKKIFLRIFKIVYEFFLFKANKDSTRLKTNKLM